MAQMIPPRVNEKTPPGERLLFDKFKKDPATEDWIVLHSLGVAKHPERTEGELDFVVMVLETVFNKDTTEATRIMLNVHNQGVGIAGVYIREIGETKIGIVHEMARKNQYPLKCSLEKVNM
jgi:hypothetical protein